MLFVMIFVFFVLMFAGVPLAITMVLASVSYLLLGNAFPVQAIPQRMIVGSDSFTFLAIPFFFLAGELMNNGGLMIRIVKFVQGLVGFIRGGLAYVNVVTNMIMAGMSGSALADAAATGTVLIPAMEKAGYSRAFAAALTAAAGTIGPIIPPSIPFVLYAGMANLSVGKMFMAGAVPGVGMGLFLIAASYFISVKRGYGKEARQSFREIFANFRHAFLALLMPVIILGGILSGVTTATEAAVVAAVYSLIVSMFIFKAITVKDLPNIIYKAAIDTAVIMFIVSAASMFGWILGREQVPQL